MSTLKQEIVAMARLAGPVVFVQLGLFFMNFMDTVMVGHMAGETGGEAALASVAVGGFYHWMCVVWFMGCLMALDPVVAQAVGARDEVGVARGLQRGLLLAAVMAFPAAMIAVPAEGLLRAFGQPPEVVPRAAAYAWINAAGALPFLVFVVLRQSLQAMHRLRRLVAIIVTANVANIFFNWMLIYGNLGFAAMGVAGSAWATVLARWFMAAALLALEWRFLGLRLKPWRRESFALKPLLRMVRLGAPIGTQFVLEFGIFGVALLLMGRIGVLEQEGHQIALNLASLSFMFPLGISSAAAVRVGHAVGRRDPGGARRAASVALLAGAGVMAGFAVAYVAAPHWWPSIYTWRLPVIAMAASLLPIAGVFQVFDGVQVVAIGVLRGLGDTATPALINILGFWLLGLPVSLLLAFPLEIGAQGIWWGLVAGLGIVAVLLLLRVRTRLSSRIERVQMDDAPGAEAEAAMVPLD